MSIRVYILVVSLGLGVVSLPAKAQSPKESNISKEQEDNLFTEASQQFKLQEYDKALESFKELYRLTGEAIYLFNIAQCNRLLGKLEEALKGYKLFLQEAPNSEMRPNAQARVTELEVLIAKKKAEEEQKIAEAKKLDEEKRAAEREALKDAAQRNTKPFFLAAAITGGSAVMSGGLGLGLGQLAKKKALSATSAADVKKANTRKNASVPLSIVGDILGGVAIASAITGFIIGKKSAKSEVQVLLAPWGGELVVRF
jgi:tetratricopeptide (TPR) repeat protein